MKILNIKIRIIRIEKAKTAKDVLNKKVFGVNTSIAGITIIILDFL